MKRLTSKSEDSTAEMTHARPGVGPLIPPLSDNLRPIRLQVFERIRAAGLIARVQLAKELNISPATVTKLMDRGSTQTIGIVSDAEPFLRAMVAELNL